LKKGLDGEASKSAVSYKFEYLSVVN